MANVTFTLSVTQGGQTLSGQYTITDPDQITKTETTLTSSQTNKEVLIAFEKDLLSFIMIVSDKQLTIKSNSSSEADDTFTVKAGQPFLWVNTMPWTNPFENADVTKLFITNAASATANVTIWHAADATP